MPVSVSVSVWMRVSARQIPLDPPPLVSSPNADPPIILAKCSTYILMPGPIVLDPMHQHTTIKENKGR